MDATKPMTGRRNRLTPWLVATSVVAALVVPMADARVHRRPLRPLTFKGSCQFSGVVTFTPAATVAPHRLIQHAFGPGTCSGTLTDHHGRVHSLLSSPATYDAHEGGANISCEFGRDPGAGAVGFRWGELRFKLFETRVGPEASLDYMGAHRGSASGQATASGDPVAIAEQCAGGGLRAAHASLSLKTQAPLSG